MFDRLTRSRVIRLNRLEEVEDVLCARCRPQGEETVVRIGEGPTTSDRHETRVTVFREDHTTTLSSFFSIRLHFRMKVSLAFGPFSLTCGLPSCFIPLRPREN